MIKDNIKILLIDDDEDEYIIIKELLLGIPHLSFDILWVDGYKNAIEMIGKHEHDLCLLDYRLGEVDGIEVMREFKKQGFNLPIILLTGKGNHDLDLQAMQEGAADYLEKASLEPISLERCIRYAVRNSIIIQELKKAREKQRELSMKILDSQEKERQSVARDLHDSIGSSLSAVHFALDREITLFGKSKMPEMNFDSFNRINEMIVDIIDETRRISGNLRPSILDNLGVLLAIKSFVRQFQKIYHGMSFEVRLEIEEEDIPDKLKIIFYRIVQEGLNNAVKHSQGTRINVIILMRDGYLLLEITDNGKGFNSEDIKNNTSQNNMGLEGMIERGNLSGGEVEIISSQGEGTRIKACFPIVMKEE